MSIEITTTTDDPMAVQATLEAQRPKAAEQLGCTADEVVSIGARTKSVPKADDAHYYEVTGIWDRKA